jgi:hypothetical protein
MFLNSSLFVTDITWAHAELHSTPYSHSISSCSPQFKSSCPDILSVTDSPCNFDVVANFYNISPKEKCCTFCRHMILLFLPLYFVYVSRILKSVTCPNLGKSFIRIRATILAETSCTTLCLPSSSCIYAISEIVISNIPRSGHRNQHVHHKVLMVHGSVNKI